MKIHHLTTSILANEEIAQSLWRLRLEAPAIATSVKPGQFVMLRQPGARDPLLGRPLAIYRAENDCIDVIYAVVGKGTRLMAALLPGNSIEVWGPLGNGWNLKDFQPEVTQVLVAGGIGQTPMYLLANQLLQSGAKRVCLCMGSRDAAHLSCTEDFASLSSAFGNRLEVRIATDDGSVGHHGFVTDLLENTLEEVPPVAGGASGEVPARVYACGPGPMLRRVAEIAQKRGIPCQVSLETPMACGMGICFTCVTKCKADNADGWDYCRTCTEGPVFDAAQLVWD